LIIFSNVSVPSCGEKCDESQNYAEHSGRETDAATRTPLARVRLLAPIPEPRQMRDVMAFERHFCCTRFSA
jgi:hypothetical protein